MRLRTIFGLSLLFFVMAAVSLRFSGKVYAATTPANCPGSCMPLGCGPQSWTHLHEDKSYKCSYGFGVCCVNDNVNVSYNNLNKVLCNNTAQAQINTALGCVPVEPSAFVAWMLPNLFKIVGGISFLLMVYGFIIIATSGGDPKAIQGGKETITSAIAGLLFSIFAIFILRLIVIQILHIPGIQ